MIQSIIETYPDEKFLVLDGLNAAIIGVEASTMRLIYSVSTIIECLMEQCMTDEEAIEYYDFNIGCLYAGEKTPILCEDMYFDDEHLNN